MGGGVFGGRLQDLFDPLPVKPENLALAGVTLSSMEAAGKSISPVGQRIIKRATDRGFLEPVESLPTEAAGIPIGTRQRTKDTFEAVRPFIGPELEDMRLSQVYRNIPKLPPNVPDMVLTELSPKLAAREVPGLRPSDLYGLTRRPQGI